MLWKLLKVELCVGIRHLVPVPNQGNMTSEIPYKSTPQQELNSHVNNDTQPSNSTTKQTCSGRLSKLPDQYM